MYFLGHKLKPLPEEAPASCKGCVLYLPRKCVADIQFEGEHISISQGHRNCSSKKIIYEWATQKGRDKYIARLSLLRMRGEI